MERRGLLAAAGTLGLVGLTAGLAGGLASLVALAVGSARAAASPRVVALDFNYVEGLLALGIVPVGVADLQGYAAWVGVGAERLAQTRDVGTRQEPSLEVLLALQPDLIVGPAFRLSPQRRRLEQIAETLLLDAAAAEAGDAFGAMAESFLGLAAAVGRAEDGAAVLEELEAGLRVEALGLAEAGLAGEGVMLAQFLPGSPHLRAFRADSLAGGVLARLGLANDWQGRAGAFGFDTVDVEALARSAGNWLLYVAAPRDEAFLRLSGGPLWPAVPAVAAGRARALPPDTWFFGGPLSCREMGRVFADALRS